MARALIFGSMAKFNLKQLRQFIRETGKMGLGTALVLFFTQTDADSRAFSCKTLKKE
jgi:hypothetical protein